MTLDLGKTPADERWRSALSLVAVGLGLAGSFFAGGISWAKVEATAGRLEAHALASEHIHEQLLRKDGQEIAEMRVRLDLILQMLREQRKER